MTAARAPRKGNRRRAALNWILTAAILAAFYLAYRILTGELQRYGILEPVELRKAVILIHGLDEPGLLWREFKTRVDPGDWAVHEFAYPNDQTIPESSRLLRRTIERHRFESVILIGHSMGCLVIRDMLSQPSDTNRDPSPAEVKGALLIAPPNHGSNLSPYRASLELKEQLVRLGDPSLKLTNPFREGSGAAGRDLIPGSAFLEQLNARQWPPQIPAAVLIGYDSPVEFKSVEERGRILSDYLKAPELPDFPYPELLDGYGDGSVTIESALHPDFPNVQFIDDTHRPLVDNERTVSIANRLIIDWIKAR